MILITGGARSGKSTFGKSLLKDFKNVLYIATAIPFDDEMKERVEKHKKDRPNSWYTLEAYKEIESSVRNIGKKFDGIILDCITMMISNLLLEEVEGEVDYRKIEHNIMIEIEQMIRFFKDIDSEVVIVTNEVGSGIVPENIMSRAFRDIVGRVNQYIAKEVDEVYVLISGIPLQLKKNNN